jgi:hypothetical protein
VVDGAHVEAYLTEMAHEITKRKREDPKIMRNDPRVTMTKDFLEKIVRETKVYVTGKVRICLMILVVVKNFISK